MDKDKAVERRVKSQEQMKKAEKQMMAGIAISVAIDPALGMPIGLYGAGKGLAIIRGQKALEKTILKNPFLAEEFAEKAKGTKAETYFKALSKEARGIALTKKEKAMADLQRIKYRDFIRKTGNTAKGVLERNADLATAARKWNKRNQAIKARIERQRKIRQAREKAKNALMATRATARKLLKKRKKTR